MGFFLYAESISRCLSVKHFDIQYFTSYSVLRKTVQFRSTESDTLRMRFDAYFGTVQKQKTLQMMSSAGF
ncbi:hypothetical protein C7T94_11355 [Pedobacter yulinensis]|uniref:Uncharacterized protein n=1 Tax=Pedobacter yulinensis TaxID=2126353 RepID=A0A2T3HL91_9SPHI|nr:hypothetical protein C7T94_11355 [Pedobacter yulinensis]